ncbi:MAG: hypothetical protein RLZZ628_179 [Bacteroidota bacterium]|jgi:hypothetical protein
MNNKIRLVLSSGNFPSFPNCQRRFALLVIQLLVAGLVSAQKPVVQGAPVVHAVKIDSSKKAASLKSDFPNPKTALLWSIVPTGGQFYNQKYWYIKVPIALGGYGIGISLVAGNGATYRERKSLYFNLVNSPDGTLANNATFFKQRRDDAFKAYQQSWIFLTIWHLFCAAEAFTAAHLAHFDVSEDLSWQIRRGLELSPATTANGFGIQLKF